MGEGKAPLSAADLEYVRSRYQQRIGASGVTFKSMNSGTLEKQSIRHSVHAGAIDLRDPSLRVLDVNYGLNQFLTFLRAHGFRDRYLNLDIVPEYVDHCR